MQQQEAHYGIIGYPLTVTFSPDYFNRKFADEGIPARYDRYPIEDAGAFPALLQSDPLLRGFNVTMPHKTAILPFLDALSDDAAAMGAVNCIAIQEGRTTGWNTDWIGFGDSLAPELKAHHSRALILGTGGASRAVAYALGRLGIRYRFVSRRPAQGQLAYTELDESLLAGHLLLINTTPLGMGALAAGAPELPYELLTSRHLLYDLVYTPPLTPFLQRGLARGAAIKNGSDMFRLQAEASWRIWNGGGG